MKIRRLEIQGFKSFADRTVLRFGDGVTGIVGPNGCGKSNIVDAIRWVMGEQSAKHLRGAGMQDVIFAGSEKRGPMGMAEVTITFKNDGQLVPPEYQKHDEISVTRRLFRDGTSEYAINKVNCRLRDILDLFMGTGIGKNAYSIIEQGRIGLIVTSKPEDRRAFIEDAAGVSRYKARRKQAERRIEATEQNLARVTDLTTELETRLKSLEKQAEKAEKYKRLKAELRALELHQGAHRHLELIAVEGFERRALADVRERIEAREHAIAADEARMNAAEAALDERKGAFRTREHELMAKQQAQALAENNAESFAREKAKLAERRAEAETELVELDAERTTLRAEAAEAERLAHSLGGDAAGDGDSLDDRQAALDDLVARHGDAQSQLEADKQALFDILTAINDARSEAGSLDASVQDLAHRIDRLRQSGREAAERSKKATHDARKVEAELARTRQLRLDLESRQTEQADVLGRLEGELETASDELARLKDEQSDKRARLASLVEIQKNYEGCTQAVRALMRRQASGEASVHGLVADVVSAEPRFEAAVEAVLGDRLQYVIVDSQQDGIESVQFLRESGEGRSTFVPLDLREDHVSWAPKRRTSRPPLRAGAETADLASGSGSDSGGSAQLGDGTDVEAPGPTRIPSEAGPAYPAPQGDVPEPGAGFHAAIRDADDPGGDAAGGAESHLVRVENDSELPVPEAADSFYWIESEEQQWPDLEQPGVCGKMVDLIKAQPGYEHVARVLLGDVVVVEDLARAREVWRDNGHRKTLVTLQGEVLDPVGLLTGGSFNDRSAGILAQKRRIKELTEETRALESKLQLRQEQHDRLKRRLADTRAALDDLAKKGHAGELSIVNQERDLARLRQDADREANTELRTKEEVDQLEAERAAKAEAASERRDRVDALLAEKEAAEQKVGASSEQVTQLGQQVQRLQAEIADLRVEVAARREKRDNAAQTLERISKRLEDIAGREQKLRQVIAETEGEMAELDERVARFAEEGDRLKRELSDERVELDALSEALIEAETELRAESAATREKRAQIDALKEESGERSMKIRECEIARQNLREQLEERYGVDVESILVDYHAAGPLSDADKKSITKLRRQIDNMGPINLTAIEECAEVRERYGYLSSHQTDLEEAVSALRNAIKRINKTSKERYVEAFHLVNEKFQQIFPKLFNGGRCALVMTDENDPLESGVEIMAQPPGKKLQSVNLLSGGEKALTAVSLIFAIFLIKPTPFCLLDEVDAPLDEANVGRYNDMLREMSAISQFILITHNKRTMELPDRLYGVTMEDPGISKLVPVDVVEGETRAASNA
jgi:chromosome segregation protein